MNIDTEILTALTGAAVAPSEDVVYSFSLSTGGFYPSDIDYPNLPGDLIELTLDEYDTLKARPAGTVLAVEDGVVKIVPAPPLQNLVPGQVTMRQARLALLAAGKLAAVDTAIAAMPNPQKDEAQIEWGYASTVERDSAIVALLGPALGLDDAALDALFTQAATL